MASSSPKTTAENNAPDEHRPSLANSQVSTIIDYQQEVENDNTTIKDTNSSDDLHIPDDQSSYHSVNYNFNNNNNDATTGKCDSLHPLEKKFSFEYIEERINTIPERITIITSPLKKIDVQLNHQEQQSSSSSIRPSKRQYIKSTFIYQWIKKQSKNPDNRYAFQMAVAFIISTLFVVIDPISDVFPNTFWVGVSVVTVLDNTVGGFLSLSLQRLTGTLIGGGASIVSMTITRAAFHPKWEWEAIVLLCFLLFVQVFFIAKLKTRPNMAYTGGIGLLTTIIISLSGYSDLIHDRLSYCAELGAWRTMNLILGILIAMLVAFFVFPLKASKIMRKNIGKAMEDAADLYEKATESYLSFSDRPQENTLSQQLRHTTSTSTRPDPTANTSNGFNGGRRDSTATSFYSNSYNKKKFSFKEIIRRTFSTRPPESNNIDLQEQQVSESLDDNDDKALGQKTLKTISTGAYTILTQLQTESNRLKNVSTEYAIQTIFHFFGGGRQRCQRDLRRAKRYNQAIEAMKHIVWPLTSFRLMIPLISNSKPTMEEGEVEGEKIEIEGPKGSTYPQQSRYITQGILECFTDSISVMRQLATILKKKNKPLSAFMDEWSSMDRMVTTGSHFIQKELKHLIHHPQQHDNIKLISYYGFLVRCSVIWEGLRTILDKLSPLNGTLSRASSMGTLPNREPHVFIE